MTLAFTKYLSAPTLYDPSRISCNKADSTLFVIPKGFCHIRL